MFTRDKLKQTRYIQDLEAEARERGIQPGKKEGMQEGKLETVPILLELGLTVEQIVESLNLNNSLGFWA